MKSVLKSMVIFALVFGCAVNNNGDELLLTTSVVPSAPPQCSVSADSQTFVSVGTVDVVAYVNPNPATPVPRNYVFSGLLTNQMGAVTNDEVGFANLTQVQADANNVVVDGYYVTYVVNGDSPAPADPGEDSSLIKGATTAFVSANGAAVPAQGQAVASALLLPNDVMTGLLQDNPGTDGFTISAHIKADSHTQDGRRIQSNEIVFPIDVCYGCLHPVCAAGDVYDFSTVCDPGQDFSPGCVTATTAR